jgi:IS5 family transposase
METGRQGLSAESVRRCAVPKQYWRLSYEELAFHLEDSSSFQAFARLALSLCPKKSVLQKTISRIRAETWQQISWALLTDASRKKIERGTVVRIDSSNPMLSSMRRRHANRQLMAAMPAATISNRPRRSE